MIEHSFDQICIPVTEASQPAAARRAAVALAQDADLDEPAVGNLALVVTELATNSSYMREAESC